MGINFWVYNCSLLLACIAAMRHYKRLDSAARIFAILLAIGCLSEIAAYFSAKKFHNNYLVYNMYSCVELLLLCLFFNYSIDVFRKNNAGIYIGMAGFLGGIADMLWIEKGSIYRTNVAFIFLEYIIVISLCLFALTRMLVQPGSRLTGQLHFRLTVLLVFFFSLTFPYPYFYDYVVFIRRVSRQAEWFMECSYDIVNLAFYLAVIVVFLKYPKMQKTYG
jgi:hypothetical protein